MLMAYWPYMTSYVKVAFEDEVKALISRIQLPHNPLACLGN